MFDAAGLSAKYQAGFLNRAIAALQNKCHGLS
jgi:hypothetical protein